MKSHCLPYSQVPHTTRLFTDFLSYSSKMRSFYPRSPHFSEWVKEQASVIAYPHTRRERVANVLELQNRQWGAGAKTLENLARFRRGAFAVVTGQQVGLFGGPAYSIYKALTAAKLVDEAVKAGLNCVPIFWMATEDHDLAEVNHTSLLGPDGALQVISTPTKGLPEAPMADVTFGTEIEEAVRNATALMGDSDLAGVLRNTYRPNETMGSAYARLCSYLFADWGVILLDPTDPEFHAIAEPIFHGAIERAGEVDEALLARGKALESAGYHQQVKVTASSTLLFTLRNGARTAIHRRANGNSHGEFLVGKEAIPQAELLRQISTAPHHFNANVLLRPVMQDYLLPTLAYVGGPAEVAYFAQGAVVYEKLLGRITPVIPRFSATIIEPRIAALLERYGLEITDLFHGLDSVREHLAKRSLPADLKSAFEQGERALQKSLSAIQDALARLDPTLVQAAQRAGSKMQYQLGNLQSRAARAELLRTEILARHASLLNNNLYPHKNLQEREIGGIHFVARYGMPLLRDLYDNIQTDCLDHQLIFI